LSLRNSPTLGLLGFLAAGKMAVILSIFMFAHTPNVAQVIQGLGTKWDSNYYEIIATHGYNMTSGPYVFSPVYPLAIRALYLLIGNAWAAALLITNILSFVFPILLYKTFGYRTALFAELFPTYLVYTTVAYSDVIALLFLAACFLLLMRNRVTGASAALSGAIFTFYNIAWTLPAFLLTLRRGRRLKLLFYIIPIITGTAILFWFKLETGDYFSLLRLEAPWQVGFANPLAQVEYLLCPSGAGAFTCQSWQLFGISLPPLYWVVRNMAFEAFYVIGALYLLKTAAREKVFLSAYCLSVIIPLLFVVGLPALSIPRLLLPAFPIFVGFSEMLKGKRSVTAYVGSCYGLAVLISLIQYFAFFA
jgi:hypothetical protein